MSWDISVMASSTPPPPVEQMPRDWRGVSLGSQSDIRQKISTVLPRVDWSDPTWGIFEGEGFSFEFNMGEKDPSDGFMVHVRGGGPAVTKLFELGQSTGWFLLDCSQGEWLHHCKEPDAGWIGFQAYRDRVIASMGNNTEPSAAPNGGSAKQHGNSRVSEGAPSVN
jgi:hypothetical protein